MPTNSLAPPTRSRSVGALLPESPIASIKGVGRKKEQLLNALGFFTTEDFLYAYPRAYEDRTNFVKISSLSEGVSAAFIGEILSSGSKGRYAPGRKKVPYSILVGDESGAVEIVFFNATWISNVFVPHRRFLFFGTPEIRFGRFQLIHPDFESLPEGVDEVSLKGIVPIYALKAGLSQRDLRKWHREALAALPYFSEYLPDVILEEEKLVGIEKALANIHFPADHKALEDARYRLIYEELFLLQTGLLMAKSKRGRDSRDAIAFPAFPSLSNVQALFPFALTGAQNRTIEEVFRDMETPFPMNRLIQGDVGSGKTAVAAAAMYKAVCGGYQAAMMVPTEILARQHFESLSTLFANVSANGNPIQIVLLTASLKVAEKREVLQKIQSGDAHLILGTHALLQNDVHFSNLGMVVTDEQHRFGVEQRIGLKEKGLAPDVLVMTATPIPRTLAFILYGDLDMSVIDERPPGRRPILTKALTSGRRDDVYDFVEKQIREGRQAYIVAARIEEEAEGAEMGIRSAEGLAHEMDARFEGICVALLHGGMKREKKEEIMDAFYKGSIQALVSTVVIEVGIDVKNATVMVIEN
ncbi:MAG: ATP-dependent DNA helicase RecG, partial [Clostridiales Family XIII bacterium]|nr:ATP-dependent DNA helicase RecG [Clostridiales Family XIII bacterium]